MRPLLVLEGAILSVRSKDILHYECQYVMEDALDNRFADLCEGCEFIVDEPDINCSYCPSDFDFKSAKCMKAAEWITIKRYMMYADMLLRNTLGDIWNDEYSA